MKVIPDPIGRERKAPGPIRGRRWLSQTSAVSKSCIAMSSSPTHGMAYER